MKHLSQRLLPGLLVAVLCGTACFGYATDTTLVVTPDTIKKGSTQPIRISWPTSLGAGDQGLENVVRATVGGQAAPIIEGSKTKESIIVSLPSLQVTGADVRVLGENDTLIGTALLRYEGAAATPDASSHTGVLVLYGFLLVLFPFALMFTDILKAYRFARESRADLISKFSPDKLTLDELKLLVADFDTSPPGIPGLARATLALTLLLLLGLILVYVLVICKTDIPPETDKLLTSLTTAFAAIIAFYFGTRAAETSAQNAAAAPRLPPTGRTLNVGGLTPDPPQGKTGDSITLKGTGFGSDQGVVTFNETNAKLLGPWSDTEVKVEVPPGVSGPTIITLTTRGGVQIKTAPGVFNVTP